MPDWQDSVHVDIGALAQRVTGLESGVQEIRGAIGDLSKKLDAKPTNWFGLIAALTAVLTVIGGAIAMLMSPINYALDRHEREITHITETAVNRADYMRDHEEAARWIENLRDRLRFNEDRGVFKGDLDRVEEAIAKGAENAATKAGLADEARRSDERINTIAGALHELQHDLWASRQAPGVSPAPAR
jgi:hypothetical protein